MNELRYIDNCYWRFLPKKITEMVGDCFGNSVIKNSHHWFIRVRLLWLMKGGGSVNSSSIILKKKKVMTMVNNIQSFVKGPSVYHLNFVITNFVWRYRYYLSRNHSNHWLYSSWMQHGLSDQLQTAIKLITTLSFYDKTIVYRTPFFSYLF